MSEQITLSPKLHALRDEFVERCRRIAAELETAPAFIDSELMNNLRIQFMAPLKRARKAELDEELHLIAVMSVVIDLIGQGWSILSVDPEVRLGFERQDSLDLDKERTRRSHLLDRDTQLSESSVVQFIKSMEKRRLTPRGWHSIFSVMRDGELLASELRNSLEIDSVPEKGAGLGSCISPYLQFVTPDAICEHTGLRLNDIWRYFRHTWVNSYRSIPGRSMMVLSPRRSGSEPPGYRYSSTRQFCGSIVGPRSVDRMGPGGNLYAAGADASERRRSVGFLHGALSFFETFTLPISSGMVLLPGSD